MRANGGRRNVVALGAAGQLHGIAKWTGVVLSMALAGTWTASIFLTLDSRTPHWHVSIRSGILSGGWLQIPAPDRESNWSVRENSSPDLGLELPASRAEFWWQSIALPLWCPTLAALVPTAILVLRDRWRYSAGCCRHCGVPVVAVGTCPSCKRVSRRYPRIRRGLKLAGFASVCLILVAGAASRWIAGHLRFDFRERFIDCRLWKGSIEVSVYDLDALGQDRRLYQAHFAALVGELNRRMLDGITTEDDGWEIARLKSAVDAAQTVLSSMDSAAALVPVPAGEAEFLWNPVVSNGAGAAPLVRLPLWIPFVFLGGLVVAIHRRDRHHWRAGTCRRCGYDLTGNTSGRCPECGNLPTA